MQSAVRRARFLPKASPLSYPTRGLTLRRTYTTGNGSSQQIPQGQNAALLLAGTALLSATSGYFFATYESQRSGSTRRTEEAHASGLDNPQYGTAKDFRDAIEELKAAFPEFGAVSDDPEVLGPYGFSENDYHPGIPCLADIDLC